MEAELASKGENVLSGADAFKLYDTYGFPIDLTKEILEEKNITIDEAGFNAAMEEQRVKARNARKVTNYMGADATVYDEIDPAITSTFVGYDKLTNESEITVLTTEEEVVDALSEGDKGTVIVDETVFYATMGGQEGDKGVIKTSEGEFAVETTIKLKGGKIGHVGTMTKGMMKVGDTATMEVSPAYRADTCKNHSATHLLQKALRTVLGDHVEQKGSYVDPDRLRFDFTHFQSMTAEELKKVEDIVNEKIVEAIPVETKIMTIEEAKKTGAMALFGEKYGESVRVVCIDDFSKEFCGGTHVANTANIRLFKIVSEAGVGTVAAGVAKAGAQTVLISGYDGGTGAAPRSSIHNAGLPWELGLAETHQTLIMNGLRNRVRIETDGKLMSGRDVVIAALLGAEEFGFATAPLVTMGCVMMRVCNLDTCPVGVATQNPELRKRFRGKPEYVENFMRFIAQEMREYMARLGVRTVDEMVGHTELLKQSAEAVAAEPHKGKLDLSAILNNPYAGNGQKVTFDPKAVYNFELEKTLDEKVLLKKCARAISKAEQVELDVDVTNTARTFGTILGAEITRQTGTGLPDDTIVINCHGAGGQSFGAFIPKGLTLKLTGDSNDYFGKGLSGGKLIVKVPEKAAYKPEENIIIGNVALYGATSGYAFINGVAGERFAVRNSGAYAVVEGVGEHGCEYMTGGRVVVLGRTGKNFAAGMSGGIAYVLDVDNKLYKNINKAMISIEKVENKYDKKELRDLIEAHVASTGSKLGTKVLDDFDYYLPHFKKLIPNEYKKMITLSAKLEEKGLTSEQAQMEAFYESIGAKH